MTDLTVANDAARVNLLMLEQRLQRDSECRLLIIDSVLNEYYTGRASWREAAARIKAVAVSLPDWATVPR